MKFNKIKNRTRITILKDGDWYETNSGAKFPVKTKPMIFSDLQEEFNASVKAVSKAEAERIEANKKKEKFDLDGYTKIVNDYVESFYDIVIMVSKFNGYEVDLEYIKANMSFEDPYWYITSVATGLPTYSFEIAKEKKKK